MTQEEIIEMARQAQSVYGTDTWTFALCANQLETFAKLVAEKEREACAKMFDEAMPLVPFVQNDQGGCLVCGFTPKLAALAIRARGQA